MCLWEKTRVFGRTTWYRLLLEQRARTVSRLCSGGGIAQRGGIAQLNVVLCPQFTLLATAGAHMVGKSRNMSADMIFMPGLLGLMLPTLCEARTAAPTPVDTCTVTPKNLRAGKEEGRRGG